MPRGPKEYVPSGSNSTPRETIEGFLPKMGLWGYCDQHQTQCFYSFSVKTHSCGSPNFNAVKPDNVTEPLKAHPETARKDFFEYINTDRGCLPDPEEDIGAVGIVLNDAITVSKIRKLESLPQFQRKNVM